MMRKWFLLFALAALLIPTLAMAQSAFDGTWKIDMNKVGFPKKPDEYLLQNGMYECKTCAPPYKIKADGSDQPVGVHKGDGRELPTGSLAGRRDC